MRRETASAGHHGGASRDTRPLWLVSTAFALGIGVSAVPTPLYTLYERRDGFGSGTVTVVFAAFSLTVAVSLIALGPISDRIGRRRALVPALLLDAVSCAVFVLWPALPGLLVGRVLCGIAVGVIATASTAWLVELRAGVDERARMPQADVLAAAANLGGVGVGSLAGGVLAQYAPDPLRLPFLVYLVLILVVTALIGTLPEARESATPGAPAPRMRLPATGLRRYAGATLGALVALATLALFASLVPTFLTDVLRRSSRALAGGMAFIAFVSAATGQVVLARLPSRVALAAGYVAMPSGLAMMTTALWISSLGLFLAAGVVTGAGAGLVFKRSLGDVAAMAPTDARAALVAGVYLASYLGLAVSIVGVGIATRFVSEDVAMLCFATAASAGVAVVAAERVLAGAD